MRRLRHANRRTARLPRTGADDAHLSLDDIAAPGGAAQAARLLAGLTHSSDVAATVYLTHVLQQVLRADEPPPLWIAGRDVRVEDVDVADALPDYAKFGLLDAPQPPTWARDASIALRQALAAVAGHEHHPEAALLRAVNHSGRSALTGAVAGALLGARVGVPGLPAVAGTARTAVRGGEPGHRRLPPLQPLVLPRARPVGHPLPEDVTCS
ncbi:ADP-ribosylglycohydrolase family protein [Actinosynnema sp. CA-248983]